MRSDFELLDAWRDGDAPSGNALVERHFESVYNFFRTKFDRDVDDLVQRTFLACVEARDDFRKEAGFRTFLYAIARNQLRMFLRTQLRRDVVDFSTSSMMDLGPSPSQLVADRSERRRLLRALREIPLDHQIALELFYWEGLTGPELAKVLEVPEGTARTRLRAARHALELRLTAQAPGGGPASASEADLARWVGAIRDYVAEEHQARRSPS